MSMDTCSETEFVQSLNLLHKITLHFSIVMESLIFGKKLK